jgi:PAS domain-containing protein
MKVIDLLMLPQPSQTGCKRHLLEEYLHNPFLDDDLQELALRLGVSRAEVAAALGELCQGRFLKTQGQRGYALELSGLEEKPALPLSRKALVRREAAAGLDLAESSWLEALPFGLALLRADGGLEQINERAATWMGIPREEFDGPAFERATGVDPTQVLAGGTVISFTRRLPFALEVEVRPNPPTGVVIVVQDVSLREELAQIQASFQELFFSRLRVGFVEPLEELEAFLENPAPQELGLARAAVEQLHWVLAGLLADPLPGEGGSPESTPETE